MSKLRLYLEATEQSYEVGTSLSTDGLYDREKVMSSESQMGVCKALILVTVMHPAFGEWYSWFYFSFEYSQRYQKINHWKAGNTCWVM